MADTNENTEAVHIHRKRHRKRLRRRRCSLQVICLGLIFSAVCLAVSTGRTDAVPIAPLEPAEPPAEFSAVSLDDWQLLLVNRWNPIPDSGYPLALTELENGHAIDARAYTDLQEMMDACRAAGLDPMICSSYRTWEKQQELYENKIQRLLEEGLPQERAVTEAGTVVAVPGTSEHQTGMAFDVTTETNEGFESTEQYAWLRAHAHEYGFIQRYPANKADETGISYEPWHYRYVGRAAASEMNELGLCLEEYVDWLKSQ